MSVQHCCWPLELCSMPKDTCSLHLDKQVHLRHAYSLQFVWIIMHDVLQDRTLLQDVPNMLVLVILYMMQGVPLGLTMGAM